MHTHISRDDRVVIADGLRRKEKISYIADRIQKDKSAVSREVKRNSDPDGTYNAKRAHKRAMDRRRKSKEKYRKIENDEELEKAIEERLHPLVSPEVVAYENGIAHETIYAWIYRSRSDLKEKLPQGGRKRRKYGSKRGQKQGWTKDVRSIHEKPEADSLWEGDTVLGSTKTRVMTHVEKESLFAKADLIPNGSPDSVHARLKDEDIFEDSVIVYDRGSEFALWRMIENDTGATLCFADAHSPWQRGVNENTNGRLRRVFPKGFDFATITQRELDEVVYIMNHTPRKSRSWQTPCELYGKCCNSG